jgi:hypothetical protein
MCLYAKYLANMTQVSDVAPGPLVFGFIRDASTTFRMLETLGTNIFHNCTFVLEFDNSTKLKEKQCWRRKVTEHGGTVSYVFTRKVS